MIALWTWTRNQTMAAQFALASAPLVLAFALLAGTFTAEMAGRILVEQRAGSTALLLHNLIQPNIRALMSPSADTRTAAQRQLSQVLANPVNSKRFPYLEVWRPDGTLLYSRNEWLIGRSYPLPAPASRAFGGDVVADYTDLLAGEHRDRDIRRSYLEIYSPVRLGESGEVVAVAEIHEDRTILGDEIARLGLFSHLVVLFLSLVMLTLLSLVVRAGGRTIAEQRAQLIEAVRRAEERELEINELHRRQMLAAQDLAAMNERIARSIGADLHDGPAQTISYAVLSLHQVRNATRKAEREALVSRIEAHLVEALGQIRATARTLVLPEVERLSLTEVVRAAVHQHETKTGTSVALTLDAIDLPFPAAVNICVFRFLQEGLHKAFLLAGGWGQRVGVTLGARPRRIFVAEAGGAPRREETPREGFGLHGLRYRIESVGGQMNFETLPGRGSRLTLLLDRPA